MAKKITCWESNDGQKFDSKDEALRRDALMYTYKHLDTKKIGPSIYDNKSILGFLIENRDTIAEVYRILDGKE